MASRLLTLCRCQTNIRQISRSAARFCSTTTNNGAGPACSADQMEGETHFGFETVRESEKEERVHKVFHNVASSYDVMNDAMSAGVHRLWKDAFIQRFAPPPGTKLIDVAGGTGDIAFRFLNYMNKEHGTSSRPLDIEIPSRIQMEGFSEVQSEEDPTTSPSQNAHVTVFDINQAMLDEGKKKAERLGFTEDLSSWVCGNAECLPMDDNQFDAYTIAFGIRNVTHIEKVLTEAYRVLKPGGRFMCLEFSEVPNPVLRKIYDEYSFQVIPVMGQVIAGDWHSYQYLVESIRQFPNQETFATMIRDAGFKFVRYENLTFGVAAIHSGIKL
ncbi:hypothetical protein CAPTEDRAFT_183291 [Capitella teleta]|uniref:2-methoxy-6-polyprenyl-1,4-benzoquinol methylase, mitochondrial n=1 Tax=Capitella teleta TaxID=283909 RepID=R7TGR4_CAPTE|nr:hypothetical protein CAPTEDRAFT_183291 [Capitella teleta]|eukprot:ELT92682.1 hypothetical protein CAPTEDRAFT_183291 [Capitella teleta]